MLCNFFFIINLQEDLYRGHKRYLIIGCFFKYYMPGFLVLAVKNKTLWVIVFIFYWETSIKENDTDIKLHF